LLFKQIDEEIEPTEDNPFLACRCRLLSHQFVSILVI
jgi:hypothetical protein